MSASNSAAAAAAAAAAGGGGEGGGCSSLDEAFELLRIGKRIEEESSITKDHAAMSQKRMEAAAKYYEACYLMKRYVNRLPIDTSLSSAASSRSESAKTRRLIQSEISHYENRAATLLQGANNGNAAAVTATFVGGGQQPPQPPPQISLVPPTMWNNEANVDIPLAVAVPATSTSATFNHPAGAEISLDGGSSRTQSSRPNPTQRSAAIIARERLVTEKAGQANARLARALDLDEQGGSENKSAALREYMVAAEIYLQAIKIAEEIETEIGRDTTTGKQKHPISGLLKRRLEGALDRIEELKDPSSVSSSSNEKNAKRFVQRTDNNKSDSLPMGTLTPSEIEVLKKSSLIASGLFMPWSEEEAKTFDYGLNDAASPFADPDGLLKLSTKQIDRFYKWCRPADILTLRGRTFSSPASARIVMVKSITPYSIRQKCVTDCSFIASLCICAAFERRFNRRLVTSIIYPQNKDGYPIYNKGGKYMVKLWLNGVARRVVVDDLLPVDKNGNLLCSHTDMAAGSGGLELWVSIIEKAYMKLCGGYDFPGSNSGVDLFSLTGWIPERIFFPEDPSNIRDFETGSERAWERLHSANSYGDCLITVSTSSEISEEMADRVGLVTGHAYAVLSVLKTTNGTRLLQLKNPWAHKGWKGRFSSHDKESWRDATLCAEVGYNPSLASKYDDGVFWISWEDILVYFRNLHLSWNPALFAYRVTTHGEWPKEKGPVDDSFNVGDNPQYILTLSDKAVRSKATIWLLLSRHVTKQEQEGSEVTDYLTLHIHRNNDKKERIWYPGGKTCVLTGAYTNNPHVLIRYDVTGPEDKYLSLVLSQYQKSNDLTYTLSCYCTNSFKLGNPAKDLPKKFEIVSSWTEESAGGPPQSGKFGSNPMWSVTIPKEGSHVQITCGAVKSFAINVMLVEVESERTRLAALQKQPIIDTGDYRHGFVATGDCWVPGGNYTLIVSTFNPGQIGSFKLTVKSTHSLKINQI